MKEQALALVRSATDPGQGLNRLREYIQVLVLRSLHECEAFRPLAFVGGTALRLLHGLPRFSEDLDFTGVGSVPTGTAMESAVREACAHAVQLLDPYAPVEIVCERHTERNPHPGSQEAFDIRARFPWHRQPHTRVMVEVALDEKLLRPPSRRPILHDYGEPLGLEIATYSLEEIVAEKLRAILQHAKALENRGWVRSRARDYYDLWRILGSWSARLDVSSFDELLREKCTTRSVTFSGSDSFFPEAMLALVEKTWAQWLGPLVPDLPACERVIGDLRPLIEKLLSNKP